MKKIYLALASFIAFTASAQNLKLQSFEGAATDTWGYTTNPAAFTVGTDIWDTLSSLSNINSLPTDGTTFFGVQDLANNNGGTATGDSGIIAFDTVHLNGTSASIMFDYEIYEFDDGDRVVYELWENGTSVLIDTLVEGVNGGGASLMGTETVNITALTDSIRFEIRVTQNGGSDYAGFDNVRVVSGSTPTPTTTPFYPIADINNVDANGEPDSIGVYCWTQGVVLGVDMDGNNGYSFTIWHNEGIGVYNGSDVSNYVVTEGDSIRIRGEVNHFNGLAQLINIDSIEVRNTGNAIPAPTVVSTLSESTESALVRVNDVLVAGTTSAGNYILVNGVDTVEMRIDYDTDVDDSLTFNTGDSLCYVIGIGGQFDSSIPRTEGYQLFPRSYMDVDTSCGGVTPPALVVPTYDIAVLRTVDANFEPDSIGVYCAVEGIVYGVDLDGNNGLSFTVVDETGGINVFNYNDVDNYVVTEGDEIRAVGTIDFYNGLTELFVDSITILSTNNCIPFPTIVTGLSEATESNYIELRNVVMAPGQFWPAPTYTENIRIVLESGDTVTMRVDGDTFIPDSILSAPTSPFTVIGIGGQFDNSAPYDEGYQIFPMYPSDFDTIAYPAPAGLVINELMADNDGVIMDDANEYDDWIELYNGGTSTIDIAGLFITDDATDMIQYRIPRCNTETELAAGEWTIIWADGDEDQGPLHANFSLSANGEFVGLYTQDGTVVDTVSFGASTTDVSFGRRQDGAAEWVEFEVSTPDASNNSGVVLSVEEVSSTNNFVAYPNPVNGDELFFNQVVDVTVYNAIGGVVMSASQVQRIAVDTFEPGMYIIRTTNSDVVKVVVR